VRQRLQEWASRKGYRAATGPGTLLVEAEHGIISRAAAKEIDTGFVNWCLRWVNEAGTRNAPATVIVVAVPCPAHTLRFTLPDRLFTARIPPTYFQYSTWEESLRKEIIGLCPELKDDLHAIPHARKALAVRMGLVAYGANNITYCPGMGSFHRMGAFTTSVEMESRVDGGRAPGEVLEECASCGRCRDACPTGAISHERFLLKAERCLTLYNESPGPWPAWIPARAHNCLVGCIACQEICPCNEGLLRTEDSGVIFTREETDALLAGGEAALPPSIKDKLESIGMAEYAGAIGRNLAALIGTA
jgi:epoxyqueuosine reductase